MAKKKIKEIDVIDSIAKGTKYNDVFNINTTDNVTITTSKGTDILALSNVTDINKLDLKKDASNIRDLVITNTDTNQTFTIKNYFTKAGNATKSSLKTIRIKDSEGIPQDYSIINNSLYTYEPIITKRSKSGLIKGTVFNDTIMGSTKNDKIKGNSGDDIIYGDFGNDKLYGGKGGDTFVFSTTSKTTATGNAYYGDGTDTIYDAKSDDTIKFLTSEWSDLTFKKSGNNLIINYLDQNDTEEITKDNKLTIKNYYKTKDKIEKIITADGEHNLSEAVTNITGSGTIKGTDGADIITGGGKSDKIIGGKGDDTLDGGKGKNTYIFNTGDGADTIKNSTGNDTVKFNKKQELTYEKDGDNLVINYGEGDKVTLENYFVDNSHSVKTINNGGEKITIDKDFVTENVVNPAGDNIYYANNLTSKMIIADEDGYDSLVIKNTDVCDIKFFFDVQKDENGVYSADSLYILNNEDLAKADSSQFTGGVEIKDYFKNITLDPNGGAQALYGHDEGYNVVNVPANATYQNHFGTDGNDAIYYINENQEIDLCGDKGDDKIYINNSDNTTNSNYGFTEFNIGDGNDIIYGDYDSIEIWQLGDRTKSFDDLIFTKTNNDIVIKYSDNDSVTFADYFITEKNPHFYNTWNTNIDTMPALERHLYKLENYKNTGHIEFLGAEVNGNNKIFDMSGFDKLFSDVVEYVDSTEFSSASEVLQNGTAEQKEHLLGLYQNYSVETKNYNRLNDWDDKSNTYIGTAFDDMIISCGTADIMYGGAGNDYYAIASLSDNPVINDSSGNDTLLLQEPQGWRIYFNVYSDDKSTDDLYLMNWWDNDIPDFSTGVPRGNVLKIENYFGEGEIENIKACSGYVWGESKETDVANMENSTLGILYKTKLDTIKSDVASWLTDNGYASSQDVFTNEKTEGDIQALLQVYKDAQANIWME